MILYIQFERNFGRFCTKMLTVANSRQWDMGDYLLLYTPCIFQVVYNEHYESVTFIMS